MTILGIVINVGATEQVCYHPNYKTIGEIRDNLDNFDTAVLVFENFENSYFVLDLKKLFKKQDLLSFNTWDELGEFIETRDTDWLSEYQGMAVVPSHMQITDNASIICPFGSFTNNQMKIFSYENGDYGDVAIADIKNPYRRDGTFYTSAMKDVVFYNTKEFDITNAVPIIYGCAFKPNVWTNAITGKKELFAKNAGRILSYAKWNQKRTLTASHALARNSDGDTIGDPYKGGEIPVPRSYYYNEGILMLDFSPLGTIDVIDCKDFHDAKLTLVGYKTESISRNNLVQTEKEYSFDQNDWVRGDVPKLNATSYKLSFYLPEEQTSGIPIVSIFGRLLFVQEYVSMRDTSKGLKISVTLPKDLLERILLSNMQHYGHHIDDTTEVQILLETALRNLFSDNAINYVNPSFSDLQKQKYADCLNPFVIMLHTTNSMRITRISPKMTIAPDKLVFPANSGGLLVNTKTLEIIDYVRSNYNHDTLVMYAQQCPLHMVTDGSPDRLIKPQLGHERYSTTGEDQYLKYSEFTRELRTGDGYELIDISYLDGSTQSGTGLVPSDKEDTDTDTSTTGVIEYDRVITNWMRPIVEYTDNPETPEDDPQTIIWPNKESTGN